MDKAAIKINIFLNLISSCNYDIISNECFLLLNKIFIKEIFFQNMINL